MTWLQPHYPKAMEDLTLYGPHWSAYTRTVRMTLEEKAAEYRLVEVDFLSGKMPKDHLTRHPFGKVPVLEHNGFQIYETTAICRYLDVVFEPGSLQPSSPRQLGRMAQIIAVLDSYLSKSIRIDFFSEATLKPLVGLESDEARVETAYDAIRHGISALEACCDSAEPYLVGSRVSLADMHAAPLFGFLAETPAGMELIEASGVLHEWWEAIRVRASYANTSIDIDVFRQTS